MQLSLLPPRQMRFVDFYVAGRNATHAAILAGYSETSAAVTGHRLLRNPHVARHIAYAMAEAALLGSPRNYKKNANNSGENGGNPPDSPGRL